MHSTVENCNSCTSGRSAPAIRFTWQSLTFHARTSCPPPSSASELAKKALVLLSCANTFTMSWAVVGTCPAIMPPARSKTARVTLARYVRLWTVGHQFAYLHSWGSLWVSMGLLRSTKGNLQPLPPIRLLRRRSAHRLAPLAESFLLPALFRHLRVRILLWRVTSVCLILNFPGVPPSVTTTPPRPTATVRRPSRCSLTIPLLIFFDLPIFRTGPPAATLAPRPDLGLD